MSDPNNWWDSFNPENQKDWPQERVGGWAPGDYICTCRECGITYVGDKRSWQCYPCAAESETAIKELERLHYKIQNMTPKEFIEMYLGVWKTDEERGNKR